MRNVNFVNLDIQGVELRALKSMESYLNNIDYIYTEVNIEEVYKDCDQMSDLTEYLARHNFSLVDARIYREYGWGDAFYIKNKNLYNRMNFQKHKLKKLLSTYDPLLSEWENMKLNGYDRIWDCGSLKFEINY